MQVASNLHDVSFAKDMELDCYCPPAPHHDKDCTEFKNEIMELNYDFLVPGYLFNNDLTPFQNKNLNIDSPVVPGSYWIEFEHGILDFHFDFPCTHDEKAIIMSLTQHTAKLPYPNFNLPCYHHCFVQKFEKYEDASMLHSLLKVNLKMFVPIPLSLFQTKDSTYIALAPLGDSFIPCKDNLFEFYDAEAEEALFITEYYKHILRCLISCVCLQKGLPIRCRIDLDNIFIPSYSQACIASFAIFDVQEAIVDDDSKVIQKLRNLFERINSICCIEGGACKAEFDLLFDGMALGDSDTVDRVNGIFDNVLFWTKAERIMFLKKILELSKSDNIKIYGEYTRDVFGDDWESMLSCHSHMGMSVEAPSKRPKLGSEECMLTIISTIIDAYDKFGQVTEMWKVPVAFENSDQVVEFVQHRFPRLFGALAQGAKKQGWLVPMMVNGFLDKQLPWGKFRDDSYSEVSKFLDRETSPWKNIRPYDYSAAYSSDDYDEECKYSFQVNVDAMEQRERERAALERRYCVLSLEDHSGVVVENHGWEC